MYQVYAEVKTRARTYKGLNRAIEKETGEKDFFESQEDIEKQIRSGWIELTPTKAKLIEEIFGR